MITIGYYKLTLQLGKTSMRALTLFVLACATFSSAYAKLYEYNDVVFTSNLIGEFGIADGGSELAGQNLSEKPSKFGFGYLIGLGGELNFENDWIIQGKLRYKKSKDTLTNTISIEDVTESEVTPTKFSQSYIQLNTTILKSLSLNNYLGVGLSYYLNIDPDKINKLSELKQYSTKQQSSGINISYSYFWKEHTRIGLEYNKVYLFEGSIDGSNLAAVITWNF
jgi:hypothetical protein